MPSYSTRMGHLSADQFAAQVNAGGASRMLHTREEAPGGGAAQGTFAVGLQGHEQRFAHPVARQEVQEHEQRLLSDPTLSSDPDAMQGGWPKSGKVYLDASRQVAGRRQAMTLGRQNKQIAVYDMEKGDDVYANRQRASHAARTADKPKGVVGNRDLGFAVVPKKAPRSSVAPRRRR